MSNPNHPKWRTLAEELAELERTDPEVKAAADELDRVKREIISKPRLLISREQE